MPDVFTKAKRSLVMSRIRSTGNKKTELALMAVFRRHRITGWRRHVVVKLVATKTRAAPRRLKNYPLSTKNHPLPSVGPSTKDYPPFRVRPDFVFKSRRTAVFVDGCFWHGCPKHGTMPVGNRAFWKKKLTRNADRDRLVTRTLRRAGWRVLRIWEHDLLRKREPQLIRKLEKVFQ